MKCPKCGNDCMISNSKFVSEIGSTDVFVDQTFVCVNEKCGLYSGTDLNNPKNIVCVNRNNAN